MATSQIQLLQKSFRIPPYLKKRKKKKKKEQTRIGEIRMPIGIIYVLNKWVSTEEQSTGLQVLLRQFPWNIKCPTSTFHGSPATIT